MLGAEKQSIRLTLLIALEFRYFDIVFFGSDPSIASA